MEQGAIEILRKHGCLYMKDDYKALFEELEAYYKPQEQVKNIAYEPVLATGRKSRADRRNEKAEKVCREARYQMAKFGGIADNDKLCDLVLSWLKYGRKICYKRP